MSSPLLATRFFAPRLRADAVARPRLLKRLLAGLDGKLTLVAAPAGFGKSTLLAALLTASPRPVAWLSLAAEDQQPLHFLRYLVAALQRLCPARLTVTSQLLQLPDAPPPERVMLQLLNELAALDEHLVLVLDDYHLTDNRVVDNLLQQLLEQLPPSLTLVIATREDPDLPLARWRARGELTEIRARDLRFDPAECGAFLQQTMQLSLDGAAVAALETRTEGWIAGLQLAALSLQQHSDPAAFIAGFSGSHRFVLDYLLAEVLQGLTPDIREFLLITAHLPRFCAGLCEAVTGQQAAAASLQWLEQNHLFLIALDDQRCWYRYHHLFADVLQTQAALEPARLNDLHRRASVWFEQQGMISDAIQEALLADDSERATDLLENHWPAMRFYSREQAFMDWMQQLPASSWQQRPVLGVYYGLTLLSWDLAFGIKVLDHTEAVLASDLTSAHILNTAAMASVPGILAIARAYVAGVNEDINGLLGYCQQALDCLPERDFIWRGAAAVMQGMVHWRLGEMEAALAATTHACDAMAMSGDLSALLSSWCVLADMHLYRGDLVAAGQACEQGLSLLPGADPGWPQGSADLLVLKACLAFEQGADDAAAALLAEAQAAGDSASVPQEAWRAGWLQARMCWLTTPEQALSYLERASQRFIGSPGPCWQPLDAWKMRVLLVAGRTDDVRDWIAQQGLSAADQPGLLQEFEYLTLVRWQLAERAAGHCDVNPQPLLTWLWQQARDQQRHASQIDISRLLACWHWLNQDLVAAEAEGWRCLQLAARHGFFATLLEDNGWHRLLAQLQARLQSSATGQNPAAVALLQRLLQRLPITAADAGASAVDPASGRSAGVLLGDDALSSRELEVLRYLDSELTGPQIAARLFVSLNTFRSHSKNIYAKLNVKTRQAALRKARALGLLGS